MQLERTRILAILGGFIGLSSLQLLLPGKAYATATGFYSLTMDVTVQDISDPDVSVSAYDTEHEITGQGKTGNASYEPITVKDSGYTDPEGNQGAEISLGDTATASGPPLSTAYTDVSAVATIGIYNDTDEDQYAVIGYSVYHYLDVSTTQDQESAEAGLGYDISFSDAEDGSNPVDVAYTPFYSISAPPDEYSGDDDIGSYSLDELEPLEPGDNYIFLEAGVDNDVSSVPEPASCVMLTFGVVGLSVRGRKANRA